MSTEEVMVPASLLQELSDAWWKKAPWGKGSDAMRTIDQMLEWRTAAVKVNQATFSTNQYNVITRERLWMQHDNLNRQGDSTKVTKEFIQKNDKKGNLRPAGNGQGNLVSSLITLNGEKRHLPVLDLDYSHAYVPTTTPGHAHLYLNNGCITDAEYETLLAILVKLGILGRGTLVQFQTRGCTLVRRPGLKKEE